MYACIYLFIYFKDRERKSERDIETYMQTEKAPIMWFTLQIPTTARVGPSQNQELEAQSRFYK